MASVALLVASHRGVTECAASAKVGPARIDPSASGEVVDEVDLLLLRPLDERRGRISLWRVRLDLIPSAFAAP
jgi:hypothetical protein